MENPGDDPFDTYSDVTTQVGVGASDKFLLAVSLFGFSIMSFLVYSIIIRRVKSADELEKGGDDGEGLGDSYEEELLRSDVSTLNRAQRRARAKALMKRQRRAADTQHHQHHHPIDGDGNELLLEDDNDHDNHVDHNDDDGQVLSRKERQKAAKAAEKKERHLMEEERREEQRQAMMAAQEEKKKRLQLEAEKAREEKIRKEKEQERQRQEEFELWKTFLISPDGMTRLSVEDWVKELEHGPSGVIPLGELAERFDVSIEIVKKRIRELVQAGRVTGLVEEERGLFLFLTHSQLLALATFIKEKGEVTLSDVSRETTQILQGEV